jgi:hypothetical protein
MSRPTRFPLQQGRVPPEISLEGDPDGKALALMWNPVVGTQSRS